MSSQAETKADPPQDHVPDEFLNAMKNADSEDALKEAFKILSKDQNHAHLSADALRRVMEEVGLITTKQHVEEIIRQVKADKKDEGEIYEEEFIKIIKLLKEPTVVDHVPEDFLNAMKNADSDDALKKAFKILSKDQNHAHLSADVLHRVMEEGGLKLTKQHVEEIIRQVKADTNDEGEIYEEQFIKIIKLLKEPTVVDQLEMIYKILGRKEKKNIVLYGESGVGKTWMAKKIADRAVRQGKFDIAVWIHQNRDLKESVAYQLSVLSAFNEWKAKEEKKELEKDKLLKQGKHEEDKEEKKQEEEKKRHEEDKEKKRQEKLEGMIRKALENKKVLLVFDEGESRMEVEQFLSEGSKFYGLLGLGQLTHTVLHISRNHKLSQDEIGIMVGPLTLDKSISEVVGDGSREERDLAEFVIGKTKRLPSEVLIIKKVVSESRLQKLQSVKKMILENQSCSVTQLLINEYKLLPRSVLIDCYSSETSERHFLHGSKTVTYNELISYWIMEGHLGQFDCIEDAYKEGHRVLMDLVDCGLLRTLEAGYVVSSGAKFDFDIHERYKFFGGIQLGLATTFDNKLGNIALADGMIRTITSGHDGSKLLTLLLDGNHFGEIPDSFFKSYSELEILAIFNPTNKPFPLPVSEMQNLRLLILRGCEFLESIEAIFKWEDTKHQELKEKTQPSPFGLKRSQSLPAPQTSVPSPSQCPRPSLMKLTVLEISGPSSLKMIPDDVFKSMPDLRNLNLSHLKLESLPLSFYRLTKLEILILRGCSSLKELDSLKNFKDLQVLDLSGSTSFENLHDKSFSGNKKLQIIDLSQTRIEKLPLVRSLKDLKSLCLRDCPGLQRIRKIDLLGSLQVFDISGSTKVEEFLDPSLDDLQGCEFLDVSRTSIKRLPFNVAKVRHFSLRGCSQLKELTPFEVESNIEVLELSGSSNLVDIKGRFLDSVKRLTELNLSETNVQNLPSLSPLSNLRRLLLSHCELLKILKGLSSLQKLEVLDLSGCKALEKIEDDSFDNMERLESLDLSKTGLTELPSLSKLTKLKELHVRYCPNLTKLPGVEELPVLKKLDHSGTILKPSPSFNHHNHRPCVLGPSSSDNFDDQKLLNDLGLTNIHDRGEKWDPSQEVLVQCNWSISIWQHESIISKEKLGIPVNGVHFIQLLKMYPSLLTKDRFHFCVFPTEAKLDKDSYRDELSLRNIYFTYFEEVSQKPERCLEIRGFNDCPPFLQDLLKQAEFLVLTDNPFLTFLHLYDGSTSSTTTTKICWIERCNQMEHVFGENFADEFKNIEILWVSDAMKFRSLSSPEIRDVSFTRLKCLYLEYCPQLSGICSSFLQLESLEILHIRYCAKFGALFEDESAKLDNLTTLNLWGLPELKKISCKLQSLCSLRVGQCPLLEHVLSSTQGEKLKTLQIKFCDNLKSIFESQHENVEIHLPELQELELWALPELQNIAFTAPSLQSLKVGECHSLENVVDSGSVLENLEVLEVKSCEKVKKIIKGSGLNLRKLHKMELMSLPEVESIGADPKEEKLMIYRCPKLQKPVLEEQQT